MKRSLIFALSAACAACGHRPPPPPECPSLVCRPAHRRMLPAAIWFAYGSAEIDPDLGDNRAFFDAAAPSLARRDDVCGLVVVGYSSPDCDPDPADESLSRERAIRVRDELVRVGVDPELLAVRWVGSRQPTSGSSCIESPPPPIDPNRRVMFEVWICPPRAAPPRSTFPPSRR